MKLLLMMAAALGGGSAFAQNVYSSTDTLWVPFLHGVASGDPLGDRVILWTRLTLSEESPDTVWLSWYVATDTLFQNALRSGTAFTHAGRDYTVKVDADGLQPDTWYYYRFEYNGLLSPIGRTRTLPIGDVEHLRLAVVSCADYQRGYYHAYRDLALRNWADVVLHLGDYLYEYPEASLLPDRQHRPPHETVTLQDYRQRHAQYKQDKDLQLLHRQLPMIAVWDDHEIANNAWANGAQNHLEDAEGPWEARKRAAKQAYFEWMPVREDAAAEGEIYRKFAFGRLLSLYMLDTRLEGRSKQGSFLSLKKNRRELLGPRQLEWLSSQLRRDSARWTVLGQQVMMAPLRLFGLALNADQWDGYRHQRRRLYDSLLLHTRNLIVLTGDLHTAWACDLPLNNYMPFTGENTAGVEFVATSITSAKIRSVNLSAVMQWMNPHVKFADLKRYGYFILDVTPERAQAEFVFIDDVEKPTYTATIGPAWATWHGSRHLVPAALSTPPTYPPLAPAHSLQKVQLLPPAALQAAEK